MANKYLHFPRLYVGRRKKRRGFQGGGEEESLSRFKPPPLSHSRRRWKKDGPLFNLKSFLTGGGGGRGRGEIGGGSYSFSPMGGGE